MCILRFLRGINDKEINTIHCLNGNVTITRTVPAGHWGRRSQWFWSIPLWNLSFQPAPTVHILEIGNRVQVASKMGFQDGCTSFQLCQVVLWEDLTLEKIIVAAVFWPNVFEKCDTQAKSRKSTSSTNKKTHLESFSEGLHEFSAMPRTCLRTCERGKVQSRVVFSPNVLEKCDMM